MGKKLTKALECAKKIGKGAATIIVGPVIYNPVVWIVWALISPTSAVGMMEENANKTKPLWWFVSMFFVVNVFVFGYLLPWKVRQEVSKKIGFFYYTKDEVKAFDEGWHKPQYLSSKARKIVWKRSNEDKEILCKIPLSEREFEEILVMENDELVITNVLANSPSKQRVKNMLNALTKLDTVVSYEVKMQILEYIKKCGLPSDLALECTKDGIYSSIAEPVQEALALYKEVEDVKQLFKSDPVPWKAWLGKRNNLSFAAQAEMSDWQLREYVAQGFTLHEDLLVKYMKSETKRNWVLSYVRELKEKGHLTEKAYILLTTEEWWRIKMI